MHAHWWLAVACLAVASVAHAGALPFSSQVHTFDNGLRVIMIPTASDGLVAYYSVVRTGSRDEVELGHTGFAHFFEHMMFRGTERYPSVEYDRLVTLMGADANAYTTDDSTCYYLSLTNADLPKVIEIESDRFRNLSYAERDFQTESGAVYGEYRKGRTDPSWLLEEAMLDTAFDVHTYKHTTIGFEADIAAMPKMFDYSRSFFARFYRPDNVVLLIVGDFDPDATLALVKAAYGDWKPGYQPPEVPVEPPQKGARSTEVSYPGRTLPWVSIGWKGAAFDPDDRIAVAGSLLGELGFGEASEVYRTLVLERRLAQRLGPEFGVTRDPGLWSVTAVATSLEAVPAIREQLEGAAATLREREVPPERLEALKQRELHGFLLRLDTPNHIAGSLAHFIALTGGLDGVDRYFATLSGVTPADVQEAAGRYLSPDVSTTVVLAGSR